MKPFLLLTAPQQSFRTVVVALLFYLVPGLSALAQTVTGRVTAGDDNQPLPGVSIVVKGTNAGTTSLADGTYSINASSTSTLTFSFIGYVTQAIAVGNRTNLNVTTIYDWLKEYD